MGRKPKSKPPVVDEGQAIAMKYRGVEYELVQIIGRIWRWSVSLDGYGKVGTNMYQDRAITHAKKFIDNALKAREIL
jgi:hypothetical protein